MIKLRRLKLRRTKKCASFFGHPVHVIYTCESIKFAQSFCFCAIMPIVFVCHCEHRRMLFLGALFCFSSMANKAVQQQQQQHWLTDHRVRLTSLDSGFVTAWSGELSTSVSLSDDVVVPATGRTDVRGMRSAGTLTSIRRPRPRRAPPNKYKRPCLASTLLDDHILCRDVEMCPARIMVTTTLPYKSRQAST